MSAMRRIVSLENRVRAIEEQLENIDQVNVSATSLPSDDVNSRPQAENEETIKWQSGEIERLTARCVVLDQQSRARQSESLSLAKVEIERLKDINEANSQIIHGRNRVIDEKDQEIDRLKHLRKIDRKFIGGQNAHVKKLETKVSNQKLANGRANADLMAAHDEVNDLTREVAKFTDILRNEPAIISELQAEIETLKGKNPCVDPEVTRLMGVLAYRDSTIVQLRADLLRKDDATIANHREINGLIGERNETARRAEALHNTLNNIIISEDAEAAISDAEQEFGTFNPDKE